MDIDGIYYTVMAEPALALACSLEELEELMRESARRTVHALTVEEDGDDHEAFHLALWEFYPFDVLRLT